MTEKSLVRIPYDTERISPLRLVVSPDAEYVFVLGTDGELIRYTVNTYDEAHCMLDITINDRSTAVGFCDSDTLIVTCGSSSVYPCVLVDITAMEKRAEIDEVVLAPENTGKIVFSSYSKGWGYYELLKGKELSDFAEAFIEKNK